MAANPLFNYSSATSPSPLEAGSDPEKGTRACINISVSRSDQNIYADKIAFSVPVNPQSGTAYFTENPRIAVNDGRWKPVSLAAETEQELTEHHQLTFRNANPNDPVTYPLIFSVSGLIATATGDPLLVQIVESSNTQPQNFTRKNPRTLTLPVIEPVFYLRNFLARSTDRPTVPRTRIDAGESLQLSWESNGSYFWLYDGSNAAPVFEGTGTSWSAPSGTILRDTTFIVKASAVGGGQQATEGFESVEQYASLAIAVNNPTLTGLTVSGPVTATSTLTVSGSVTAESTLDVYRSLSAHDDATVGEELTVSGNLTARSRLDVNGLLSANDDLTVGSKLSTQGINGARFGEDIDVGDKISTYGHNGLKVLHDLSVDGGAEFVGSGKIVRIRELRGPYGEDLTINSTVRVLEQCGFTIAGSTVLRDGDHIGLQNRQKDGWLYAAAYNHDDDRGYIFRWNPGNRVGGDSWRVTRD
ncbi:hypothetical protein [Parafrankia elaeagni]|uniref:hypothetical protein n=1 Tax=Parafrankia elaeagni TaxID=222534 RepID=UPI000364BE2B|nr:hypothetical protein [Parafrankia elaeagni]